MDNVKNAKLTEGPIGKTLARLTAPMVIGMLGMLSFNLIDTYFIGQLGKLQLAAISFTFPITYSVTAISLGIGTGASALVSRAIGSRDTYWAVRYSSDSLMLGVIIVAMFLTAGVLTIDPLFTAIGADSETLPMIRDYMLIWYSGIIFVVIPMIGNSLLRATGDTKTPSFIMMFAVIVNLALDPILIFGWWIFPAMGIKGAAVATVVSRALTFALAFYYLFYRDKLITFKKPDLKHVIKSWKGILYIGLPSAGTSLIVPIGMSIILSIIAQYGPAAVAGFGVASRVEALSLTVLMALGAVLGPFIGQNIGAKKYNRVTKGIELSSAFAMAWGVFTAVLLALISSTIAPWFSESPEVIDVITRYLLYVPISYGALGVLMLSITAFNILNKPFYGAALGFLRMIALYLPLAMLGSYLFNLLGVFYAATLTNFIAGAVAFLWLRHYVQAERVRIQQQFSSSDLITAE